jgi:hypothetical protein
MTQDTPKSSMYATASMAEILLSQNLVSQARKVIETLQEKEPDNPRTAALVLRLEEMLRGAFAESSPPAPMSIDRVALCKEDMGLGLEWELTDGGLRIAKQAARYSGRPIVRLFTASAGPRGVRTQLRDIDISALLGKTILFGLPRPAVHVAAVGYLANTGVFVSSAQSPSLKVIS